jgi:hypothetical protein
MPLISTLANASARGYGMFGGVATSLTAYESIQTVTLGSSQNAIAFSSIPSTYKHLQIRAIGRTTNATTTGQAKVQMNGDTGNNYTFHQLIGNGTTAFADGYATGVVAGVTPTLRMTGASSTSGMFGVSVIDILDYANTSKYKTVRVLTGQDQNGSGDVQLVSGLWLSTSAITSLSFTNQASGDFAQYTQFALYGIKG